MHNREREQEILNILKDKNGFVSAKELCDILFASESSIRRDIRRLEQNGLVRRSYGGVSPVIHTANIVEFHSRTRQNTAAKKEIAKKAKTLIQDGQIVFLDQSSTAFYLASELVGRNGITVVTNNIEIMMLLSHSDIKLIASGGWLSDENRNCLVGGDAQKTFENIFADIAFFSVKGLGEDGAVTDCSREEILVRNAILKNARTKVLLCDSAKFGVRAPFLQCRLEDVDYLVSEEDRAQAFSGLGIKTDFI